MEVSEARELARSLLADDSPRRWDHVQGVVACAELFVGIHRQADLIVAAAYLHDIGYAGEAVDTGFHQLDGGRFLRRLGCDEAIVNLVAHHSGAARLARYSGHSEVLETEFPKVELLPHRELHFCDLSAAGDGRRVSIDERLADIRHRHRANPAMLAFLNDNEQDLRALVTRFRSELGLVEAARPSVTNLGEPV